MEVTIYSSWSPKFHKGRNTIRNNNERGFLSTLFVEELLRKDGKHSYWIVLLLSLTELAFLCMFRFKMHFCRCGFKACSVMNWLKSNYCTIRKCKKYKVAILDSDTVTSSHIPYYNIKNICRKKRFWYFHRKNRLWCFNGNIHFGAPRALKVFCPNVCLYVCIQHKREHY